MGRMTVRETIDRREGRRVFGRDPAGYDRARAGHPERVYEVLRERCGLGPDTRVLEIGPGTGKVTRRLLELGVRSLVAVEPDPALAAYLRSSVGDGPEILVTTLERATLPAEAFDLAVAASSFHWVEPERGLAAILGALRPGGWWAMWWTHHGDESRADPFRGAIEPIVGGLPSSPGAAGFGRDPNAAEAALAAAGFEDTQVDVVPWTHEWDAAGIRALFGSFSPILLLDAAERTRVLDAIERVAAEEFGGRVEKPMRTVLFTARKPD
jgi:SAM-dependent methyltransferase